MGRPSRLQLELELGLIAPATIVAELAQAAPRVDGRQLDETAHNPAARGYVLTYAGPTTPCPCCSRTNWLVGRLLAECAFCAAAIALPERGTSSSPTIVGRAYRTPPAIVAGGHRRAAQ